MAVDPKVLQQACISGVICEEQTGVPCELTVAQWALESGWGQHAPGNNCFGIKGTPETGQLLATAEWLEAGVEGAWVAKVQGREAVRDYAAPADGKGRFKYKCKDWFAKYSDLTECFKLHAKLLTGRVYQNHIAVWKQDGDIEKLVRGIAPLYATDPAYADRLLTVLAMPLVKSTITKQRQDRIGRI